MDDRGHLTTEQRHPGSMRLDQLSTQEAFDLFNEEDAKIAAAVREARDDVCRAIELAVRAFRDGGRLIYVGAGTSGRLGILDATECPPTFLSPPAQVQGVIAGGLEALTRSVEGAEDRPADGAAAMDERSVGPNDVVIAIASGGTTPYAHAAIRRARDRGAATVFLACVPFDQVPDDADVSIRVITGPEVLTGSTRLKAGTATKMVLNMITTIAMVQVGKAYENLMIDVNASVNAKLVDRGIRIIQEVTGRSREAAHSLLLAAGGHVKTAITMHIGSMDRAAAERQLTAAGGHVGRVEAMGTPILTEENR